jgi:hypothetical protein
MHYRRSLQTTRCWCKLPERQRMSRRIVLCRWRVLQFQMRWRMSNLYCHGQFCVCDLTTIERDNNNHIIVLLRTRLARARALSTSCAARRPISIARNTWPARAQPRCTAAGVCDKSASGAAAACQSASAGAEVFACGDMACVDTGIRYLLLLLFYRHDT